MRIRCLARISTEYQKNTGVYAALQIKQMSRTAGLSSLLMVKQRLVGAAASVAMDGVAPEWGQDDPLREEQH